MDMKVIWVSSEQEYFCKRDWTLNPKSLPATNHLFVARLPWPAVMFRRPVN